MTTPTKASGATPLLVVDDEPSLCLGFKFVLETEGYLVESAPDGESALHRLGSSAVQPGIMVLDMRMPGLDGLQVMRRLRQRNQLVPTVMASAFLDSRTAVEAVSLGVVDFLAKPVLPDQLRGVVAQVLSEERTLANLKLSEVESADLLSWSRTQLRRWRLNDALQGLELAQSAPLSDADRTKLGLWSMITRHLRSLQTGDDGQTEFASSRFYTAANLLDYLCFHETQTFP